MHLSKLSELEKRLDALTHKNTRSKIIVVRRDGSEYLHATYGDDKARTIRIIAGASYFESLKALSGEEVTYGSSA